ncbi:MAG: DUF4129 domain-containing protein [Halococcoides sp.]
MSRSRRSRWPIVIAGVAVLAIVLLGPPAGFGQVPIGDHAVDVGPNEPTPVDATTSEPTPTTTDETTEKTTETDETTESPDATTTTESNATTTETDDVAGVTDPSDGTPWVAVFTEMALWLLGSAVAIGLLGAVSVEGKSREWPVFDRLPVPAVSVLGVGQSIARTTMIGTVGAAATAEHLVSGLTEAGLGLLRGTTGLVDALAWALTDLAALPRELGGAIAGVGGAIAGLRTNTDRVDAGPNVEDSPTPTRARRPDADDERGPTTVEEAWLELVGLVGASETRTPGEIARSAIDRGLPAEPVRTITRAFREVVYGGRPRDRRRSDAIDAHERIVGREGSE